MIHYPIPPHKQIAYKEMNRMKLPIIEKIHKEVLSLPVDPFLSLRDLYKITDTINKYNEKY